MKNYLLTIIIVMIVAYANAFPNNDTTYSYLDAHWQNTNEQNATFKVVVFKTGNLWHKEIFNLTDKKLKYDDVYSDKALKKREDTSRNYNQSNDGVLESIYKKGKIRKDLLVGKDARVEGYRTFNDKGDIIEQKGYDENGNEIPNYIFMQEAGFPGGIKLWQMYLVGNLNQNIPVKNGAPVGTYRVVVSFLINKEGNVTEAKAEMTRDLEWQRKL